MKDTNVLVWLPSPIGDAILCTPALRAIRGHFKSGIITFYANPVVRQILSPCSYNDIWLEQNSKNPFAIAKELKKHQFSHAILLKNSFASALAVYFARIPSRIGYAREKRGFLLTEKLYPEKLRNGKFKPLSMVDYYLALAAKVGAKAIGKNLELSIAPSAKEALQSKLPELLNTEGPVIILVPGGAFGLSKCWPSDRFAQTADRMINDYNATVVISVASNPAEIRIAKEICRSSKYSGQSQQHNSQSHLINLAEKPVSLGELKALYSISDLVITNDTGPRHIAIALGRKVVSLFGPNNPVWTDTHYENEIQIIGNVPCAPCHNPKCKKSEHFCMESITVEIVRGEAEQLLGNKRKRAIVYTRRRFVETSDSLFIDPDYITAFDKLGLTSVEAVFSLSMGKDPGGSSLPRYRDRLEFEISDPAKTLYLKRYDHPGILTQIRNWLSHHAHKSMMSFDLEPIENLACAGINTPKLVSYGEQWGIFFEKRSFTITEEIPNAEALDQKLPDCFRKHPVTKVLKQRREFIKQLSQFAKKFHDTGYRHRDFYLAHIFYSEAGTFYLIDLQRVFKPWFLAERFRVKDIAQLYYSAPCSAFSRADRLRFYKGYVDKNSLDKQDKIFIHKVISKVKRIVRHDSKHGRPITLYSDLARE